MSEPFPVDVLRRALQVPGAPPRLTNVADAVRDGKFTWEEVASGRCAHPLAQALYTPRGRHVLAPFLEHAAKEVPDVQVVPGPGPAPRRRRRDDDRDFSDDENVHADVFETSDEFRRR